jgi:CrcB protein
MPRTLYRIALIFVGGGAGSVLRYLVQGWVQSLLLAVFGRAVFPLGTMVVNVSGCLVIGLLAGMFFGPRAMPINTDLRLAILVGILGGYTTFSSFSLETINLSDSREFLFASLNVILSVAIGLAATWVGKQWGEHLLGA